VVLFPLQELNPYKNLTGMKHFLVLLVLAMLLIFGGCEESGPQEFKPGQVTFSLPNVKEGEGGRQKEIPEPVFVSYTLKKVDGSIISDKISLFAFNESFVTQPQPLDAGHYQLEQFLILGADNNVIYAAPIEGSMVAELVEHPLPLLFDIRADEVTYVIPEVIAMSDLSPEDFGYLSFGFEIVETFDFDISASIADDATHDVVDYTLEIVAKDAPLGNVKWTKTTPLTKQSSIRVPAKYAHYTFKATKPGYLPHTQHFLSSGFSGHNSVSVEFIPETLDGFFTTGTSDGVIKFYFPNDETRCKLYARVDVAEGYFAKSVRVTNNTTTSGGLPMAAGVGYQCLQSNYAAVCDRSINLFGNAPFATAQDYCASINLKRPGHTYTLDDVNISSFMYIEYYQVGASPTSAHFYSAFQLWKGANNP
jgi:hypothetical protein